MTFSSEAQAVLRARRELYRYYHSRLNASPNASLYDTKAHFQGKDVGRKDEQQKRRPLYMALMAALRDARKALAGKIASKARMRTGFCCDCAHQQSPGGSILPCRGL